MSENILLYETFNARYLSHAKVAESFVMNSDFTEIAKNNHTVVLGPRGCGKTTMFKMLTTPALSNWQPKTIEEKKVKDGVPFIAIYIPSDELWKKQLDNFKESLSEKPSLINAVTNSLITTNILSNFCRSIKDHIDCIYEKDLKKEFEFAKNLIAEWSLPDTANSISAVRQALESRKNYLISIISKAIYYKDSQENKIEFDNYYFLDYIHSIHIACLAFERIYNNDNELKWALCFDELELVSKEFFEELISKLRISPSNILFKISAGPLADFKDSSAQLLHDFAIVKMWPYNVDEEPKYQRFCEEIAEQKIKRIHLAKHPHKYAEVDLNAVFGELDYSLYALRQYKFDIDINAKETEANSITWHSFKKLAELDFGFAKFLDKNGIDPENPIPRTSKNNDSIIRKIKEIVINRLVFLRFNDEKEKISGQTRKIFPIYYGKKTILNICEGNPRFIIGFLSDIFSSGSDDSINTYIAPTKQAKFVRDISDRFMSMLHTYPSTQLFNGRSIDLVWLINKLGEYFEAEINKGAVKLNPVSSFYLNDGMPPGFYELIKVGVDLGAFVKIDEEINSISNNNKSTRYRLSYLIAPQFKLPLRLYNPRSLRGILSKELKQIGGQQKLLPDYED